MSARPLGGRDVALGALAVSLAIAYAAARSPLAAAAGLAGIVFVSWVVARAEFVLIVLVAAIPWEAMLEYPSPTLSMTKLLGLALVVAYAFRIPAREGRIRFPPMIGWALLFGIVVGLSLIVSTDPAAGLSKGFRYAFFIGFFFLVIQLVDDRAAALRLLKAFCLSAAVAGFYGLLAFLTGDSDRATGPLQDPNDFAYLMATAIPIAILLYVDDPRRRIVWAASSFALLVATLATLSRGALVGIGALLLWAALSRRVGVRGMVGAAAATTVVVGAVITLWSPLINERIEQKSRIGDRNVESRIAFWNAAGEMTLDRPVLGFGPDRFGPESADYVRNNPIALKDPVVHNTYLELMVESGPLALAMFLALLGSAWLAATRAERGARAREDPQAEHLAVALKGMLLVACVSALFLSEQLAAPFWLVCGLIGSGALAVHAADTPNAPART